MEGCCSAGALWVVLGLNIFLQFSCMSALVTMQRFSARVRAFAFPSYLLSLKRKISTPDYKAPPKESFVPIPHMNKVTQIASSAMPWWVYADSRLCSMLIWRISKTSWLSLIGFVIALIWCWISYTTRFCWRICSALSHSPQLSTKLS